MHRVLLGQILKLIAVGAKGALLFAVVPAMQSGEYAIYFGTTTVALLLGRCAGFAAEEQIIIYARANETRWNYFFSSALSFHILAFTCAFISLGIKTDTISIPCVVLALNFVTSNYLAGILRIRLPVAIELAGGMPWAFATGVSLLVRPEFANQLMWIVCVSYLVSNTILAIILLHKANNWNLWPNFRAAKYLAQCHRHWRAKLISNMALALNLRALPLSLQVLGRSSTVMDAVALAFSVGEVCYQLVMVRVNRRFTARVLNKEYFARRDMISELLFTGVTVIQCSAGLYILSLLNFAPIIFAAGLTSNIGACFYCGSVALFCFYRMNVWSGPYKNSDVVILLYQALLLVIPIFLLVVIDSIWVVIVLSTVAGLLLFIVYSMAYIKMVGMDSRIVSRSGLPSRM